jgi:hypothetical protein
MDQEGEVGRQIRLLANEVGGIAAVETLDVEPLPDEPFDWSGISEADRERVEAILAIVDDVALRSFDVEIRTAARRLFALTLANNPEHVRRTTRLNRIAAGLVLAVLAANNRAGQQQGRMAHGELARLFGTTSVGDVARRLVVDAKLPAPSEADAWRWPDRHELRLASPRFLDSATRSRLVAERARLINEATNLEEERLGRRPTIVMSRGWHDVRSTLADVEVVRLNGTRSHRDLVLIGLAPLVRDPEIDYFALTPDQARLLATAITHELDPDLRSMDYGGDLDSSTFIDDAGHVGLLSSRWT